MSMLPSGAVVLERGWLSSNNVVFTRGRTAVVDTGYVTHSAQTVALVRQALVGAPLQLIASTHLHSDHCGGNAALQAEYPDARTLIAPGQVEAARAWDEDELSFLATGQRCARFRFEGVLRPGESVRLGEADWEIHAAPGHDPHSVVLFEPASRSLISADALWENGFGVVFPELDGEDGFAQVAATLDVIESLRVDFVVPGHGRPFGGRAAVDAALARAHSRLESFVSDAVRHASHAMKVLIKFKLLELQQVPEDAFIAWAEATPYLRRVHARFFGDTAMRAWLGRLFDDLARAGALRRDGAMLVNI